MSLVELKTNSTSGINNFEERSLKQWAVEFISLHKISHEKLLRLDAFRSLHRRQKDAIRYQLRKLSETKKVAEKVTTNAPVSAVNVSAKSDTKDKLIKVSKILLSTWISLFLLFDIVAIYEAKGMSLMIAWQAAILIELCIIAASMSERKELRRVAYALFSYNVLLFAFMEFDSASAKTVLARSKQTQIAEKQTQVGILKKQLLEQQDASSKSLRYLNSAQERGYITSGTRAFETLSKTLNANSSKISDEISRLEGELVDISATSHSLLLIWATSVLYFLMRSLLQFFSITLLQNRRK